MRRWELGGGGVMRFTIRDLLWLMMMVAMGVAWWIDRTQSQREQAVLMESHAKVQELRQMLGGDKSLNELIAVAKANNRAPAPVSTIVVNLPNVANPVTAPAQPKATKSN